MKSIFIASLPLVLVGCVATNPDTAVNEVRQTVAARTGQAMDDPNMSRVNALLQTNLTASSALAIALLNNKTLQAEFAEIGISQADLAQASRLHNIQLFGSWRFPNQPPSLADTEYSASADFLDLLTLTARKRIAKQNLEQTKLEIADKVLRLSAQVQREFYELQAQSEWLNRLAIIVEVNDASADFAHRQFDAGNLNELEWHNQQAPAAQAHLDMLKAKAEAQIKREQLNRGLGLAGAQTRWQMAETLPPLPHAEPPLDQLETLALKQRLDLAAKRAQAESFAAAIRLKNKSRFFPGVTVGIDTERTPDHQRVTGPTLDLEVPIFDQGQPALARLRAQFQRAKDLYAAQEVNVRSEVRAAVITLRSAREAVEYSQKVLLPLQQQILGETLLHYNAMQKSSYDLLAAKEREQRAEQSRIEALRDYWVARVALESAVGGRMGYVLPAVVEPDKMKSNQPAAPHHHEP